MRILITDGLDASAVETLRAKGHEVAERFFAPEELGAALRGFDAVVVRSKTKLRAAQLDAAAGGRLRLIVRAGVGVDNIDTARAEALGIAVRNTPRASTESVAELALAHMFSCARFLSHAGWSIREGRWEKKAYSQGFELRGRTLGLLGYGRIGRRLGQMASALGMTVLAYDIVRDPEAAAALGVPYVGLDELYARADFLSVHAPAAGGGPLIDAASLAKMKDGVCVINTSRGANVDEAALLAALESGKVFAAGLDVFADEPATNRALYTHPRVSATPHTGASTVEGQRRVGEEAVEILLAAAEEGAPR